MAFPPRSHRRPIDTGTKSVPYMSHVPFELAPVGGLNRVGVACLTGCVREQNVVKEAIPREIESSTEIRSSALKWATTV